jgi:hypothetical protein
VVQQLPAQYPTDGFFGKQTVVEVKYSNSKDLRFRWARSPSSCRAFYSIIPPDLHQFEVQWWIFSFILQTNCLEDFNMWTISSGFADSSNWRFLDYGTRLQELKSMWHKSRLMNGFLFGLVDQQDLVLWRFLFLPLTIVLQTFDYLGFLQFSFSCVWTLEL